MNLEHGDGISTPTFYRRKWIGPHSRPDWCRCAWMQMCLEAVHWALDGKLSRSLALWRQSGPTRACYITLRAPSHGTLSQTVSTWERVCTNDTWFSKLILPSFPSHCEAVKSWVLTSRNGCPPVLLCMSFAIQGTAFTWSQISMGIENKILYHKTIPEASKKVLISQ